MGAFVNRYPVSPSTRGGDLSALGGTTFTPAPPASPTADASSLNSSPKWSSPLAGLYSPAPASSPTASPTSINSSPSWTSPLTPTGTTTYSSNQSVATPPTTAQPPNLPQVPNFAPSTYIQTASPYYGGVSTQPDLDSYLRASVRSLYNPSAIENGTASGDPTQMLTSLAQNYLTLNPGAGSTADIQNLVNQYASQYNSWAQQYRDYLKGNAGNIALPAGSPFAAPGSPAATTPAPANPYVAPTTAPSPATPANTNTAGTNNQAANSNYLNQLLQQYVNSFTNPGYHTVKTPLGYTQYQANVPQGSSSLDPMTQLILSMLLGQNNQGGSQGSFWDLLR